MRKNYSAFDHALVGTRPGMEDIAGAIEKILANAGKTKQDAGSSMIFCSRVLPFRNDDH